MKIVLIPLPGYEPMAAEIARLSGRGVTPYAAGQRFTDGEAYHRLPEIRGQHVVLVGGTIDDAHVLELFDSACAAVMYGAQKLTLLVPYFGYSTMERAVIDGEAV